jgi:hypothetical protein
MWRAFFSAIGIVLIIFGIECLTIDSAILVQSAVDEPAPAGPFANLMASARPPDADRVFRPTEWFPWSLLACGSIVLLYSISLRPSAPAHG